MEVSGIDPPSTPAFLEGECEHFAYLYGDETELLETVADFLGGGLDAGAAAIALCTRVHAGELERGLRARGVDLDAARLNKQFVALDAADLLESLTEGEWPRAEYFADRIGSLFDETRKRYPQVRVFEEIGALLWRDGNHDAAIYLEELWNELVRGHAVSLLCAYSLGTLGDRAHAEPFLHVCTEHAEVIPAEAFSTLTTPTERQLIRQVQRKSTVLEHEMRYRRHLEHLLQKSVEQQSNADRRRQSFLSTLAHELRNPLAPIRNAVELIRMAETDRATVSAARTMIERQLTHLTRLVDDLMDASRIAGGKLELRKERVDLATVVARAVEMNQPVLESRQHQLRIAGPDEPLYVEADAARLTQVFSSLLSNAARHSGAGSQIIVETKREGHQAVVTVIDEGEGISAQQLPHVFEMFMGAERPEGDTAESLGIGLSLAKHLVEMHGGTIEAQSEGRGRGSRFIVRLALQSQPAAEKPVDATSGARPARRRHARILVADDNVDTARSLALILSLEGHEVRTAHDGVEALEIADAFRPHLILLDISMPRLGGYDTVKRLRKRQWASSTLLVALTGWAGEEHERRAREAGFDRHLVKPVNPLIVDALLSEHRRSELT